MKFYENLKKIVAVMTIGLLVSFMIPAAQVSAHVVNPAAPVANPGSGYYGINALTNGVLPVTLTSTTSNTCIAYTLNGSDPLVHHHNWSGDYYTLSGNTHIYQTSVQVAAADQSTVILKAVTVNLNQGVCPSSSTSIDPNGVSQETTRSYTFDLEAPVINAVAEGGKVLCGTGENGVIDNGYTNQDVTVSYSDSFDHNPIVAVTRNGNSVNWDSDDHNHHHGWSNDSHGGDGNQATFSESGSYVVTATDFAQNQSVCHFSIDKNVLDAPVNVSPVDGAYLNAAALSSITWSTVTEQNFPSEKITYQYEASDSPSLNSDGAFLSHVYQSTWLDTNSIPTPNTPEGVYYWHVRAQDEALNTSEWSNQWMFTVDNTAPVINDIYKTDDSSQTDVTGTVVKVNAETSFSADAMDYFMSEVNIDGIDQYKWSSSNPANIVFGSDSSNVTTIKALTDGVYTISLMVTDKAGNESAVSSFTFTWDTKVNPVTNQKAIVSGSGIRLSWTNPTDPDLKSVKIFKNTVGGLGGFELVTLTGGETSYLDSSVLPGVTYYYSFETVDDLGNTAEVGTVSDMVPVPVLVASASTVSSYYGNGSTGSGTGTTPAVKGEVKSGSTSNDNDSKENKENKSIPAFGISVLLLLILFGLYLLYQERPGWFWWLFFWKKKKAKSPSSKK